MSDNKNMGLMRLHSDDDEFDSDYGFADDKDTGPSVYDQMLEKGREEPIIDEETEVTLRFYAEKPTYTKTNGVRSWYVDLPTWKGSKGALAMVAGADNMLEILSQGAPDVTVTISLNPLPGIEGQDYTVLNKVDFKRPKYMYEGNEIEAGGADYWVASFGMFDLDFQMWLCPVMEFVFGGYPETIYVSNPIIEVDEDKVMVIDYTNYRGERGIRRIVPIEMFFGSTDYHVHDQWIMRAYDVDKSAYRDFAMSDIHNLNATAE